LATIVTRAGKGTPLTNNEVDANFTNLNNAKIETLTSTDTSVTITGTGSTRDLSVPVNPNVVSGPASATDNAIARFDTTTGKLIQNSLVIVDDTGNVTGVNSLTAATLVVNDNATLGSSNSDTLDVRARIISDIEPNANNAKDIGTSGRNWRDGFFGRTLSTVNLELTGTTSFDGAQGTAGQVLTSAGTGNTPTWTTPTTGTVTSVSGTSPVVSSGGATPAISLSTAYGDTLNPYGSKTANFVLAAPNGTAGVPTFRAIVAADIPTLNQNTTGTASNVTGTVAIANGGTNATTAAGALTSLGAYPASNPNGYTTNTGTVTSVTGTGTASGLSLSGTVTTSGNITLSGTVNSLAAGTYGINITGSAGSATNATNATNATTATNQSGGTVNATTGAFSGLITGASSASTDVNTANDAGSISIRGSSTTVATMSFHRTGVYAINMGVGTDNVFRIGGWSASNNCFQLTSGGAGTFLSTCSATQFNGSGAGLTGTASSLTAGAATTASTANALNAANSYTAVSFTANSDERLKTNWAGLSLDFVTLLAGVKHGTFERISDGTRDVGVSAQSIQKVIPEAVISNNDGFLSVNYGAAALVAAVELAKVVEELRAEIARLKAKVGE
jgi:hypothetical protein